jgi:hypothetical protein
VRRKRAVALGFDDRTLRESDSDRDPIRDHPRFRKLLDSI